MDHSTVIEVYLYVMLRYHKAHLTRRLILDTSADSEMEENMVEWLRVMYTSVTCISDQL